MLLREKGFKNQILILIVILLILPVVLTLYMLRVIHSTEMRLIETHKEKMAKAMSFLDTGLEQPFHVMLQEAGAAEAPRREQVKILNRRLKPLIEEARQNFPGVELGFYDRNLDIILDGDENSYGENFSKWRKAAFDKTIGTGEPVFQNLGVSGGGRLEMYRPLVRDGQVIGAVWATESLTGFYRRLDQVQRDAYLVIAFGALIGFGGAFTLTRTLVAAVSQVKKGLKQLEKDLTHTLPPAPGEVGEITAAINELAAKLVSVQNYNEIILASIDDGVLAVNLNGEIIEINGAAMAILELDQSCQGRHLTEVFPAGSPFSANLFKALREGVLVKDLEIDHPVNGRGRRQFLISTSLLRNARQEVVGAVLTCRDITERVQMEEQIRRQERLAALGKLVAGVAHEIRNPITAISGYTQFWRKDHPPSPRSLAIIHREITRLNNIVDRLLHFARPAQAVFGAHDLNALVNRTCQFFNDAYNSGVVIEKRLSPGLPAAWIDPLQMEQVLYNVLYNAAQAMCDQGVIEVGTEFNPDRNMLLVSIRDHGPGIPKEIMPHLFDPFFTTKPKGVGLGLAIAYEIMRAHGGEIEMVSQVGQGTTCLLYIPAAKGAENDVHSTGH
ncbi:MAG: two-component system sensor histidine kinase AtoS [Armatimonadetes bacterium]|nr:two-component system sensor histidine kinase AtoS [Armatimonadota bacterium]